MPKHKQQTKLKARMICRACKHRWVRTWYGNVYMPRGPLCPHCSTAEIELDPDYEDSTARP